MKSAVSISYKPYHFRGGLHDSNTRSKLFNIIPVKFFYGSNKVCLSLSLIHVVVYLKSRLHEKFIWITLWII